MTETTHHTPANVRERVAKEVYLWEATRFGADESWALRRWREESNTRRELYFNVADRILAILRTPRGEGEAWPGDAENDASFLRSWARYLRTEAQDIREAQDRADWKQQAEYTEVAAARMDQIANRIAALRSEAQGEVWREVDDLLARLERFEHDAAGESEEYWRVVAMRDRIAAARRSEGGGDDA